MSRSGPLRLMTEEQVERALDEIRNRLDDDRYPSRLKLWVVVQRCSQIDLDDDRDAA